MGVKAMLRRNLALSIALILISSLGISISPASANELRSFDKDEDKVICKPVREGTNSAREIVLPKRMLKQSPRLIELITNCGTISIRPEFTRAPAAVTFFTSLAQSKFYEGTSCHRLTTDLTRFLQCGDPTATGLGDKVFTYSKENLPRNRKGIYKKGTVVVQSRQGISSQFLIFYEDTVLGPSYSIWGIVVSGMEILEHIADAGVLDGGTDGLPVVPLQIIKVITR